MAACKTCYRTGSVKRPKCIGTGRVNTGILISSSQCNNGDGSGLTKCAPCHGTGRM
jgi:hypothetical protein